MDARFFDHPILNSPYAYPARHWELDRDGQPTQRILDTRRSAQFITPIPKPKKRKGAVEQQGFVFDEGAGVSTAEQAYDPTPVINELRVRVDQWRAIPDPGAWGVTPETARLLQHWRSHPFAGVRPFFCQVEAAETAIWLTEVAPTDRNGKRFLTHLENANAEANPELARLALKLATGAGKTTVMAMLIAWQTVNAVRRPNSGKFTRGFLVVAPGLTIKDRLRVLQPNDPDSYYASRELVPGDMLEDLQRAKIVITNYHAFKRRERLELSKGGRALLQGRGRRGARHAGERGADAPARHARAHGHEARPRAQRRGPPLLPREAGRRRRRGSEGRRAEGGRGEQRGRAALDLGARSGPAHARRLRASSTSRPRRSSCAGRATPRARCSRGR